MTRIFNKNSVTSSMVLSRIVTLDGFLRHFSASVSWKVLEVQTTNQERAQDKLQRCWTAWSVFQYHAHRANFAISFGSCLFYLQLAENLCRTLDVFDGGLFQVLEHKFDLQINPSKSWYLLRATFQKRFLRTYKQAVFVAGQGLLAHGLVEFQEGL